MHFWKLYDEYEIQRKELGKKRIDLMEQYANNYNGMPAEVADKWMADVIKLGQHQLISFLKLIIRRSKKLLILLLLLNSGMLRVIF